MTTDLVFFSEIVVPLQPNERDEEKVYPIAPERAACRLHGLVRPTDYTQRSGHRVVSHALHELHPAGIHGVAACRLAEVPATLRLRSLAGTIALILLSVLLQSMKAWRKTSTKKN